LLDIRGGRAIAGLLRDEAQSPSLIQVPLGAIAVTESDLPAYDGSRPRQLIDCNRNPAGWRRLSGFWRLGHGHLRIGAGTHAGGAWSSQRALRCFWSFHVLRCKLQIVYQQADFHIGQPQTQFRAEPILNLGKLQPLRDPFRDLADGYNGEEFWTVATLRSPGMDPGVCAASLRSLQRPRMTTRWTFPPTVSASASQTSALRT